MTMATCLRVVLIRLIAEMVDAEIEAPPLVGAESGVLTNVNSLQSF